MATPFASIFSRFQGKVQDYELDELYAESVEDYEDYLSGFLISGLVKFINCKSNLSDRDDDGKSFNINLSELEQEILSQLMLIEWYEKEVNNILEMRMFLSGKDWSRHAEQSNFDKKGLLRDKAIERADALMSQYGTMKYLEGLRV